jgi:hypothetical protein
LSCASGDGDSEWSGVHNPFGLRQRGCRRGAMTQRFGAPWRRNGLV